MKNNSIVKLTTLNKKWIAGLMIVLIMVYGSTQRVIHKKMTHSILPDALTVTVVSPVHKVIDQYIHVTGILVPKQEVIVTTERHGGRVIEIYADVGDFVKKGQSLALLDCEHLKYQLSESQNRYEITQDDFSRSETLETRGVISKASIMQKRALMKLAQARLSNAALDVQRCLLIAPEAGLIFERKAMIGGLINNHEPIYRIAGEGDIELEANVPEADLSKLRIGQAATIQITGNSKEIHGVIRLITPQVNRTSRTVNVRITLEKKSNLQLGLFTNASIHIGQISGQTLPSTTLQHDKMGTYVWLLSKHHLAKRQPVTVIEDDRHELVLQDIPKNSKVVARAGAFMTEGYRVNILEGN